jgi:hypothetical protein
MSLEMLDDGTIGTSAAIASLKVIDGLNLDCLIA